MNGPTATLLAALDEPTATLLAAVVAAVVSLVAAGMAAWSVSATNRGNARNAELTNQSSRAVAELTGRVNTEIAQMKVVQELTIDADKVLRERRMCWYEKLLGCMRQLPKYPETPKLTFVEAESLAGALKNWYFDGGGLYMTVPTRNMYFDLQDGLRIVFEKKREGRWPAQLSGGGAPARDHLQQTPADSDCRQADVALIRLLRDHLQRTPADYPIPAEVVAIAKWTFGTGTGDVVPADVVANLRELGSRLRSQMTKDVETRRESYLARSATGRD